MASQQFSSGQTQGHAQAKTDEWMQSTKDTAQAAQDKASGAAQSVQESAPSQEQASGYMQQKGEQVMNMAHGAMDSVKSTLGVGEHSHKK